MQESEKRQKTRGAVVKTLKNLRMCRKYVEHGRKKLRMRRNSGQQKNKIPMGRKKPDTT